MIDPLLGCRHSGSPPPSRPCLCRPQWSLDAKGWVGRVSIHGTESASAPSTSAVARQCSCPTQARGWGMPAGGRASCAEDSEPSSSGRDATDSACLPAEIQGAVRTGVGGGERWLTVRLPSQAVRGSNLCSPNLWNDLRQPLASLASVSPSVKRGWPCPSPGPQVTEDVMEMLSTGGAGTGLSGGSETRAAVGRVRSGERVSGKAHEEGTRGTRGTGPERQARGRGGWKGP